MDNASTVCTPCAANSTSVAGATAEAQCVCSDGYYKLGLAKTCGVCPAGSACSGNLLAQCPLGKTSATGQAACSDCAQGTYQPTVGGSVCHSCPAGDSVVVVTPQTELSAPVSRASTKATSGKLYIMRTFLEVSPGKNLTKWSFYASKPNCTVTPMLFESSDAGVGLTVQNPNFKPIVEGATRTVSEVGAHRQSCSLFADAATSADGLRIVKHLLHLLHL